MKRQLNPKLTYCHRFGLFATLAVLASAAAVQAADRTWDGTTGSFDLNTNWSSDLTPVAADNAILNNAGTIEIGAGVLAPTTGALNNFTVTGGTLSVSGGTLTLTGTIANGATGITNIASGAVTGSTIGAGGVATNGSLSVSAVGGTWSIAGGTVNMNGISGTNGGSQTISGGTVSTQDFRNSGGATTTISGGTSTFGKVTAGSSGTGTIIVSGNAIVNQNITGQNASGSNNECWVGNNSSTGALTLKDNAQWNYSFYNANSSVNFGRGAGNHTFTIQNNASFTTQAGSGALKAVEVGVAAANSRGTINLDGGTITVLGFTKSTGTGVINANGGLVKAAGSTANFFSGFNGTGGDNTTNSINLLAGGLKFDTNANFVTITNVLSGAGGLEKLGDGDLTLSGISTYTGETKVTQGMLTFNAAYLNDSSKLTVATGAIANLAHNIEDVVGSLQLGSMPLITSGTWGSSASAADNKNDDFFTGMGVIRVGAPVVGRNLKWTAATTNFWGMPPDFSTDLNFLDGATAVAFGANDNVLFDDTPVDDEIPGNQVNLRTQVQAGVVTFDATEEYFIDGTGSGLSGASSIVKNNAGTVTLGGQTSNFTGSIAVNAGLLKMGDNAAFGTTSGITVANGAQVDLNGKLPGSIHSYTIGGSGPGGTGAIINSAATALFSSGGVKNLTLTADSTIGNNGGRFDVGGGGGSITGNNHTLTKVGTSDMALRGNASGTPIHYVIAGGAAWTENSALGFGGATGTLTIKSGARAGNVGDFSIATPVTIESGGRLYTNGGTGTWTGTVGLQGDVIFDGAVAGGGVVVGGVVSGTANLTKTGPSPVTFNASAFPGNVGYTGNTTVSQGTLSLAAPALHDAGDVSIATGAILNLNYTGQDTIHALTIEGVPAAVGLWGRVGSGATHESALITGDGILNVTFTNTVDNYGTWATANGVNGLPSTDDTDGDGLQNGIEFVLGGDPSAPNADSNALRPTVTVDATYIDFVFRRTDDSAGYSPFVEYNTGLSDVWIEAEGGVDGVVINEVDDGFGIDIDQVTVRIPRALAGGGKIFARLHVTIP